MKRAYHYPSGHSKRIKKALKNEDEKIQQGSIKKFCFTIENQPTEKLKSTGSQNIMLECNMLESEVAETLLENIQQIEKTSYSDVNMSSSNKSKHEISSFSLLQNTSSTSFEIVEDPALWNNISDQLKEYFVIHPPNQNIEKLHLTERMIGNVKRVLTEKHFYRMMKNGEKVKREWLILSSSNFSVYCYVCKLFSTCNSALSTSGFCDWKHASERLTEHENSIAHRKAVCILASRMNLSDRLDSQLILQYQTECRYWQAVLIRVVAVIKFLAKRGLPFFGDNETLGSPHNGNFLGSLELLSEFDPFLAKHLQNFGNLGKGHVNYLSSSVVHEFVTLMARKVSNEIINQVQLSKYFSIIIDSTPDISHIDQLSFVVRYVDSSLRPVERFLTFIPIQQHSSEYLANTIFSAIENYKLDIMNIRGQSYDNASNMSGKYSGLQARIKEVNPLAEYIPCSAHTLNLVAMHSVESCTQVIAFFSLLQELYNFFSASTLRWNILKEECSKNNSLFTLKSHSSTRWCADADATKSLRTNYKEIISVLTMLSKSSDESALTRHEANSLSSKLQKFETTINTIVWDTIFTAA